MTKQEYKISIFKLLKHMSAGQLKLVFEYAHRIFANGIGN